ncbi:MAG TPA: hypothetical protein VH370_16825 [Humisphaera sp.]|jgi:hypothetical protein|nr:hypothetical protein [Humisphaera sp.]
MSPRIALLGVVVFVALAVGGLVLLLIKLNGEPPRRRSSSGTKTFVGPVLTFKWPGDRRR